MVARGLVASRARAQDLIRRGLVEVQGAIEQAASRLVATSDSVAISARHAGTGYVSRGAEKLAAALDHFGFAVNDHVALDIGASTGGFTQVLLARGARRVYAVDVGSAQMHASLAEDPRVVLQENSDARALDATRVPEAIAAFVADVSFISLTKVLPTALALAAPGAWLIALVKPQFEVGRGHIGKGGIVRDLAAREAAVETVRGFVDDLPGWRTRGVIASPITGGSGNIEFLLGATRDDG